MIVICWDKMVVWFLGDFSEILRWFLGDFSEMLEAWLVICRWIFSDLSESSKGSAWIFWERRASLWFLGKRERRPRTPAHMAHTSVGFRSRHCIRHNWAEGRVGHGEIRSSARPLPKGQQSKGAYWIVLLPPWHQETLWLVSLLRGRA